MSTILIRPRRIACVLVMVSIILAILHAASYAPMLMGSRDKPVHMLHMDSEYNLPTLFSTFLLWFCALLTGVTAKLQEQKKQLWLWAILSCCFFALGVDEAVSLHERVGGIVHRMVSGLGLHTFAWVIPYGVLTLVFVLIYARFWWSLPKDTRLMVAIGGGLYLSGALVCEVLGSVCCKSLGTGLLYHVEIAFEELLEFAGAVVLVCAFDRHLERYYSGFRVIMVSGKESEQDSQSKSEAQ